MKEGICEGHPHGEIGNSLGRFSSGRVRPQDGLNHIFPYSHMGVAERD